MVEPSPPAKDAGLRRFPGAVLARRENLAIVKAEIRLGSHGPFEGADNARFFRQRDAIDIAQRAANAVEKPGQDARPGTLPPLKQFRFGQPVARHRRQADCERPVCEVFPLGKPGNAVHDDRPLRLVNRQFVIGLELNRNKTVAAGQTAQRIGKPRRYV